MDINEYRQACEEWTEEVREAYQEMINNMSPELKQRLLRAGDRYKKLDEESIAHSLLGDKDFRGAFSEALKSVNRFPTNNMLLNLVHSLKE